MSSRYNPSHAKHYERQPHIFGAQSGTYEDGSRPGNYKEPPPWSPERAYENRLLPLSAVRYAKMLRTWCLATEIQQQRQAFLIQMQLGCRARKIADDIHESHLAWGWTDPQN